MIRVLRRSAGLAVSLVMLMASPSLAWHAWSYGGERTGGSYLGASSTRYDPSVACVGTSPVYIPNWLLTGVDRRNWLEIGSGYCNGSAFGYNQSDVYWYWGYAENYGAGGAWHWRGTRKGTKGQVHKFEMFRDAPCSWNAYVDSTRVGLIRNWCVGGARNEAGLESYGDLHTVPAFDHSSLRVFDTNPWAWRFWNHKDVGPTVTNVKMCGRYMNWTTYRSSENKPC